MKKSITIITTIILTMMLFVGCSSNAKSLKNGTYKAEFEKPDEHGWTEYVEITVENEKFTKVVFDSINDGAKEPEKKGMKKSEDEDYKKAMQGAGSKTWPSDFYPKLATKLIDTQDIDKVDVVAGATTSSNNFKTLVKALTKNIKKGETTTLKVKY
ncbi:MAG: FMN-binding protein [Oscillospiraceae bacterium]